MYQIECAYTCHTGNIRANNEDNFWCFGESLPVNNEGTKGICSKIISGNRVPAMAVFDGMGGESCGEIAAFLASEEFGKFYNANKRMLRDMPEDFIDDVCEKMNQAVCRYGTEHHIWSMGSTMAMLEPQERARVVGTVINKFRGDVSLLQPGLETLESLTGVPVLGVVPYAQVEIDDEDSLSPRLQAASARREIGRASCRERV